MQTILILTVTLTLPLLAAIANEGKVSDPQSCNMWQHEVTNRLTKKLDLNQQQVDQIQPILSKHAAEYRKEHEEFIEKIRTNGKRLDSEISSILTPDQRKKFNTIESENPDAFWKIHHGHGKCCMENCSKGECWEHFCKKLSLTEDQKATIKNIFEASHPQITEIRQNTSLTAEQKKEKIHTILQQNREKIKPLLTPDQQNKFEKMPCNKDEC